MDVSDECLRCHETDLDASCSPADNEQVGPDEVLASESKNQSLYSERKAANTYRRAAKECRLLEHEHFADLLSDIYRYQKDLERKHPVDCLRMQPQITTKMREIVVMWIIRTAHAQRVQLSTIFLAVNVMDRFLKKMAVATDCLHLVGLTSLLIAAKYHEIYPPEINDLLRLVGCDRPNRYGRERVLRLEVIMLCRLQFDLHTSTPLFFLEYHASSRLCLANRSPEWFSCSSQTIVTIRALARCILERSLLDYNLMQLSPSLLGVAALELADRILQTSTKPSNECLEFGPRDFRHELTGCFSMEQVSHCLNAMDSIASFYEDNPREVLTGIGNDPHVYDLGDY